jgi:prepilin-type N-terminal cleavage/methylation domain-containing protein
MRFAFTLLELLIVISVILALAGMSYPILNSIRSRSDINATTQLVHAVSAAVSAYQIRYITGTDGKIYHAWAVATVPPYEPGDTYQSANPNQMDGDPRLYGSTTTLGKRAPTSYTGFINMTGYSFSRGSINDHGQLIDRWRQPLQIAYAANAYGADCGIWSTGPDKGAATGSTKDDICSWKNAND